jgi:hypothetical protein
MVVNNFHEKRKKCQEKFQEKKNSKKKMHAFDHFDM